MTILHVAIGGALGAMLRYAIGLALRFPYATLCVNVLGSLLMGIALVWLTEMGDKSFARWQPLIMTGLLGGFTTFSAFSLDTLRLFETGQSGAALIYVAGTVLLCLLAVFAGVAIARGILL